MKTDHIDTSGHEVLASKSTHRISVHYLFHQYAVDNTHITTHTTTQYNISIFHCLASTHTHTLHERLILSWHLLQNLVGFFCVGRIIEDIQGHTMFSHSHDIMNSPLSLVHTQTQLGINAFERIDRVCVKSPPTVHCSDSG